ncbi:MAG: hypothetical protein WA607_15385, partial [Candidatus Sulfotelmatobacter sp.]
ATILAEPYHLLGDTTQSHTFIIKFRDRTFEGGTAHFPCGAAGWAGTQIAIDRSLVMQTRTNKKL